MAEQIEEKRGDPPEGEEWPPISLETLPIRVPSDIVDRLLKSELTKNACRNRGYVLDGYPRTFKDAQECFLYKPDRFDENGEKIEEEEEQLEEGQEKSYEGYAVNDKIVPSNCIVLTGSDSDLMKRVKSLPHRSVVGTHYTPADMKRRLTAYRIANNSTVAELSVSDFFIKNVGIQTCKVDF